MKNNRDNRFTILHRRLFHRVVHKPSGYYFSFHQFLVRYTPGATELHVDERCIEWPAQLHAVDNWLSNLVREVETPDLWAALSQEKELLGLEPAGALNTPFTGDEQVQIKKTIEEIRVYITSTYSLASEPLAKVNRKLDYLIEASARVGRIDWKNIFVGALVGLVLQQLIPSGSEFQQLIGVAGHLLRHVLGGMISPPLLH